MINVVESLNKGIVLSVLNFTDEKFQLLGIKYTSIVFVHALGNNALIW